MNRRSWRALWIVAMGLAVVSCGEDPLPAKPNIVLITVESLRPDHMGTYGGNRDTTPNLDALAEESVVYEDAHAVTSWTLASHASMFTGLYPSAHGADEPRSKLDDSARTLAELLAADGYQTAGFASGPYLARRHNLSQGFELYDDSAATKGTQGGAHDDITNPLLERAIGRFLEERRDPSRPLFLFAYYWDPHYDYIPPPPYDEMFVPDGSQKIQVRGYESDYVIGPHISEAELQYVVSQYEGEIRYTDHFLGRLFDSLKEANLWDDSLVIVTSDHGEEFFDHGQKGHKRTLYVESVHVPLYVKLPRSTRTGRDDRLTSLVDLYPTILEAAGIEPPPEQQGRSLLSLGPDPDRPVFFELLSTFYHRRSDGEGYRKETEAWQAVKRAGHKLVVVPSEDRSELYISASDPREQLNVAIEHPALVRELSDLIDDWQAESSAHRPSQGAEADLDADQLERLRALGYLDRPAEQPTDGE